MSIVGTFMGVLNEDLAKAQVHWTRYKDSKGRFRVDFPGIGITEVKDDSEDTHKKLTELGFSMDPRDYKTYEAKSKLGWFCVMVVDNMQKYRAGRTDRQIKEDMLNGSCRRAKMKIEKWEDRKRPAGLARRVHGRRSEGRMTLCWFGEAYVLDGRAYSLVAMVDPSHEYDPAIERFFESFRVEK